MQVIKTQRVSNIDVQIVKVKAVLGGEYAVRSLVHGEVENEMRGLCLDAANEVFRNSVNYLSTQKVYSSIGK